MAMLAMPQVEQFWIPQGLGDLLRYALLASMGECHMLFAGRALALTLFRFHRFALLVVRVQRRNPIYIYS